jgi:dUTP pyrophosphatase
MRYAKVKDVRSPERGTDKAAGIDFFVPNSFNETVLYPNHDVLIPSGIKMKIPEGFMLMGADKSSIATSRKACIACGRMPKDNAHRSSLIIGAKIIDEDYQGEIHIHVINVGRTTVFIKPGMKIAQFILVPVIYPDLYEVSEAELFDKASERGDGAFGSTDKK